MLELSNRLVSVSLMPGIWRSREIATSKASSVGVWISAARSHRTFVVSRRLISGITIIWEMMSSSSLALTLIRIQPDTLRWNSLCAESHRVAGDHPRAFHLLYVGIDDDTGHAEFMRHLRYRNAGIALQQRNYAGIKIVQFA